MTLLRCRAISKAFGEQEVLKGLNFAISEQEKVGLVGLNGSGKSTLAQLITGCMTVDEGQIEYFQSNFTIGYLRQDASFELYSNQQIVSVSEKEKQEYWATASFLGVDDWQAERMNSLSGGERTKRALATAWSTKPHLLILDEPTNHLDFQGVEWLITELNNREITTIIISHDRYFLDKTVTVINEIDEGKLTAYKGNYSEYRKQKKQAFDSQLHHYVEQKKVEAHIEHEIARLKAWSEKAHRESTKVGKHSENKMGLKEFHRKKAKMMDRQVKSRIKRLEKMELEGVKQPKQEASVFFEWKATDKRGRSVLLAEQIEKRFNQKLLFTSSSFYVQRGEKVGVIGPNGCGKSTLLQMLCGEIQIDSGNLWLSPNMEISNIEQDVQHLDDELTVENWLSKEIPNKEQHKHALNVIANMGFTQSHFRKRLKHLSHGEKLRLRIAQLVLQKQDILLLDEPTNHLDLIYREQLEKTLTQYQGTLIVVSHDRYFLEKVCNKLLVFENGRILRKEYGFQAYMDKRERVNKNNKNKEVNKVSSEQIMVIENELSYVLGELAKYEAHTDEYVRLDHYFNSLLQKKRRIAQSDLSKDVNE